MVPECFGYFGVPGGYRNPLWEVIGPYGHSGGREETGQEVALPPSPNRIGLGLGGRPPFLLFFLSFILLLLGLGKGGTYSY